MSGPHLQAMTGTLPSRAQLLRRETVMTGKQRYGVVAILGGILAWGGAAGAGEALYEFEAPTSPESNSIYRLNTATGEINWCYWAKVEGKAIGRTQCDPAGENAGPQKPGVYGLLRSPFKTETGVYRVDKIAGKVWLCFPEAGKTVCAAQQP
jgi:hypothetical protein